VGGVWGAGEIKQFTVHSRLVTGHLVINRNMLMSSSVQEQQFIQTFGVDNYT